MKRDSIGVLFLGLSRPGHSQSNNHRQKEVKLSNVEVTSINQQYSEKVSNGNISDRVMVLEEKASRYNIKESPFFYVGPTEFKIMFTQRNGRIVATYDPSGKILSTQEKYENLSLPPEVRSSIYKENPGWVLQSDSYLVSYYHNKEVKKVYTAQLKKDHQKKYLKCDPEGNMI